ncbi:putative ribosome biogenesis GTPase RsgA [Labrys miyagiensis]|uniref:Small ribosomal subunit biogenesis GTPase RsgA n=1 Tax=Labrys miyagiensis TaxID=346912 RepID=A0ABQ6CMH1_9HYPH|nr:putative ribosome biogenesis GTPase RsgA [Labrys miyagiensis]
MPVRISAIHRARLSAISQGGQVALKLPVHVSTRDFAVGDWVLADPRTDLFNRRLTRKSVVARRFNGAKVQFAAANIDVLFIVTSCNADFSVARLERYLTLAIETGASPVVVLTKADTVEDPGSYLRRAEALQRRVPVVTLDCRSKDVRASLERWCGLGQTAALVGSSGVGKSTLVNSLIDPLLDQLQQTGAVRSHDDKGRHTTTSRSLHAVAGGGWIIDTPGMRSLQVSGAAFGLESLFAEITELGPFCRYGNCSHTHEPGCAVLTAVREGKLDPARVARWRKLVAENNQAPGPDASNPSRAAGKWRNRR